MEQIHEVQIKLAADKRRASSLSVLHFRQMFISTVLWRAFEGVRLWRSLGSKGR